MTLTATPGAAGADSYLEVVAADALAAANLGPASDGWGAAATADKEKALKRATREINAAVDSAWPRFDPTAQRLSHLIFPRSIDVDAAGAPIIPYEVELATYEQATYILANAATLDAADTRRARNMQASSEPNVSYSQPDPDELWNRLAPGARHYLAGFRLTTPPTASSGMSSLRMSSGFVGGM